MRHVFLAIMALLISPNIFSQTTNKDVLQIYPPNAYALARYGEIPVDYSTGVPDISVPLMSISDRDITVNLSLSYHSRGIKVDQEATWVGLGWSLNAGGVITREVRGGPDKDNHRRRIVEDFVPDNSGFSNYQRSLNLYLDSTKIALVNMSNPNDFEDCESDIYYYNFNGRTGKFFLDNSNNVCLFKDDNLKIKKSDGSITITDDTGVTYLFSEKGSVSDGAETYITSWYLKKITSPTGGEINFEYVNGTSYTGIRRIHSVCVIDASTTTGSLNVHEGTYHAGDVTTSPVTEPRLSKITTKAGHYITFMVATEKRKDVYNSSGEALHKISLYNSRNELQKGIELNYGYFEANTSRRYKDRNNKENSAYNCLNYRLRLESVKEFSRLNEYVNPYRFEYYGDNNPTTDDIYTLPYRLSPCQDHWGYYNNSYNAVIFPGNSNDLYKYVQEEPWLKWYSTASTSLAKHVIDLPVLSPQSHLIYGAYREVNAEAAKAGTLNKILYPTGGYTLFDFEVNKESGTIRGGLRVKQIETCDNNGKINKKKYNYNGIVEDLGYIDYNRNYYHTFLYNPFIYEGTFGFDNYVNSNIRSLLARMGVPPALAFNPNYNIRKSDMSYVYTRAVKIDGSSPLRLGAEGETAYSEVIEEIEGLGKTQYHYTNCSNQYDGSNITDNNNIIKSDAFITGWIMTDALQSGLVRLEKDYSCTNSNAFTFPHPNPVDYGWKSKLLTCKRIFDMNDVLVAEDSIFYETKLLHLVPNFKVAQLSDYEFIYTRYYNTGGKANICKEVSRQHIPGGKILRTSKEYTFGSAYHNKVTMIKTSLSEGGHITEKYSYPTEYGSYFSSLIQKNILSPVDVRSYRNGKLISGMQIQYNNIGLPVIKYKNNSMDTDVVFDQLRPFTFEPYLWNGYNTYNLLTTQETRDNVTSVYLWGYSCQYPIAEIKNATYMDVVNLLGQALIDRVTNAAIPSESDMITINNLRNNTSTLKYALITTYTYSPLVGMKTATDSRGVTTYYEYDTFGRLMRTKDMEGNTLQEYDYHFKN